MLIDDVVALPPLHRYDVPVPAVKVTLPQPVVVPLMEAVGVDVLVVMVMLDVAVQPLLPVTVTV